MASGRRFRRALRAGGRTFRQPGGDRRRAFRDGARARSRRRPRALGSAADRRRRNRFVAGRAAALGDRGERSGAGGRARSRRAGDDAHRAAAPRRAGRGGGGKRQRSGRARSAQDRALSGVRQRLGTAVRRAAREGSCRRGGVRCALQQWNRERGAVARDTGAGRRSVESVRSVRSVRSPCRRPALRRRHLPPLGRRACPHRPGRSQLRRPGGPVAGLPAPDRRPRPRSGHRGGSPA